MQTNFLGRDREKQLRHVICGVVPLRFVLCPLRAAADKRKKRWPVQVGHRFSRPLRDRQGK